MSRRTSLPWSVIATAAVAGATFAGIASYVDGVRKLPLESSSASQTETARRQSIDNTNDGKSLANPKKDSSESDDSDAQRASQLTPMQSVQKSIKNYDRVRVLDVTIVNGNATIDLNPGALSGWGSSEEGDFITAIKDGLVPFAKIKSFQLRVDGKIVDSLGHYEITEPVEVR